MNPTEMIEQAKRAIHEGSERYHDLSLAKRRMVLSALEVCGISGDHVSITDSGRLAFAYRGFAVSAAVAPDGLWGHFHRPLANDAEREAVANSHLFFQAGGAVREEFEKEFWFDSYVLNGNPPDLVKSLLEFIEFKSKGRKEVYSFVAFLHKKYQERWGGRI